MFVAECLGGIRSLFRLKALAYQRHDEDTQKVVITAADICRFFAENGATKTVPQDTKSACKRICMFLRWMVRDGSPVDLGLWADIIDRRTLVMPLDTHVLQEAQKMGLIKSRTASMSAARRLTDSMREAFPDDPLKGDFALFGLGVDENSLSQH